MAGGKGPKRWRWVYLLFLIPVVATLWVPFYNRAEPSLAGIPFFYWYQLLWVPLTAAILYIVYRADKRADGRGE
jgi:4-hydroxybenzoate polyprenyltransferase